MNAKRFGQLIKSTRKAQNLSSLDLARRSNVRLFSIYCIENEGTADKYPVEVRRGLTDALGLGVEVESKPRQMELELPLDKSGEMV